jgi:Zn finger protein HypA/HybF involved in hydrogenase expression
MASPRLDPLGEYDSLTGEHARLEAQLLSGKLPKQEFELLSKQLKEQILRAETQAYRMARKDEALARKLRARNYNDPLVQQIMGHFMRTSGRTLDPEFGPDRIPRYLIENEKGEKQYVERSTLQRLADIGAVSEKLFERVLYCPRCETPSHVYLRFKCPQCGSTAIAINRMLEHLQCGTIHQEDAFLSGRSIVCPSCKKTLLNDQEYHLIGIVCSCDNCHAHFEDPAQGFFCRKCEVEFTLLSGRVVDVSSYGVTTGALNEAHQFLGANVVSKRLAETGLNVKVPGVVAGATKEVVFSLVTTDEGKTIAVDIVQNPQEVEIQPVLDMYAKALEVAPSISILAAVPRASKRAHEIASIHNITIVEGIALNEIGDKILEIIAALKAGVR